MRWPDGGDVLQPTHERERVHRSPPLTLWLVLGQRTVTTDRVAGVPVRHPVLAAGRHYDCPDLCGGGSHGEGVQGDLVPAEANLLDEYGASASWSWPASGCVRR